MAVYRGKTAELQAVGAEKGYLAKLLQYAEEVQPVTRYYCPKGYTSKPKSFPSDPKNLARDNLWFVDHEGRACSPRRANVALRGEDRMAHLMRKYANFDIEKMKTCASTQIGKLSSPNLPKGRSIQAASDKLEKLRVEMDDADVQSKEIITAQLDSVGREGLAGGYKMPKKTMEGIEKLVAKLSDDEKNRVGEKLSQAIQQIQAEMGNDGKEQAECIFTKHPDIVPIARLGLDVTDDAPVPEMAQNLSDVAISAMASLFPTDGAKPSCDPEAFMKEMSVRGTKKCMPEAVARVREKVTELKEKKRLHKALNKVYRAYHAKVKRCSTKLLPDEEEKYRSKAVKAYEKYGDASSAADDGDSFFESMKVCAEGYGKSDSDMSGSSCSRSSVAGSKVFVPSELSQLKSEVKSLTSLKKGEKDLNAWWSQFYAKQKRFATESV